MISGFSQLLSDLDFKQTLADWIKPKDIPA
jgi:hypothetical protein